MFYAARRALMIGDQPAQSKPIPRHVYAFTLDVAGQDESLMNSPDAQVLANPGRDAVSLTIFDVDLSSVPLMGVPTYRAIHRESWTGQNHLVIFGKLTALGDIWKPQHWVMDASGVGEGLWALLDRKYPTKVIPIKFTQGIKSEIDYAFLAVIETGRFRDCCPSTTADIQYNACIAEVLTGPAKIMRWGVPDGTCDDSGQLIHDDIILSDSLCSELDKQTWTIPLRAAIVKAPNYADQADTNF